MLQNSASSNTPTLMQAPTAPSQCDGSADTVASFQAFGNLLAHDPALPVCHFGDLSFSRAELDAAASDAASQLLSLGFTSGDVLAVWLPDSPAWLQLLFAAAAIGVIVVPVSTRYKVSEASHVVDQSRAKGLVVATQFLEYDYQGAAATLKSENLHLEHILTVDIDAGFIRNETARAERPLTVSLQLPLITFSTSGTTGNPKLAVHTQEGIAKHAQNVARALDIRTGDVMLCALPLYGVLGFVQAMAAIAAGGACVLLPVFKGEDAARAIERHSVKEFWRQRDIR
jgi:fatty-acyl-CoA synthase